VLAILAAVVTVVWTEGYARRRQTREVQAIRQSLAAEIRCIVRTLLQMHQRLKLSNSVVKRGPSDFGGPVQAGNLTRLVSLDEGAVNRLKMLRVPGESGVILRRARSDATH
jgi:hypothetical protein